MWRCDGKGGIEMDEWRDEARQSDPDFRKRATGNAAP